MNKKLSKLAVPEAQQLPARMQYPPGHTARKTKPPGPWAASVCQCLGLAWRVAPPHGKASPARGKRSSKARAPRGLAEAYLFILLAPLTAPKRCRRLPCFLLRVPSPLSPPHRILSLDTGLPSSRHPNKHSVSRSQAPALGWQVGPAISSPSESRL